TWHMQQRAAPMLFKDDDPAAGKATRPSPVAPAQRSPSALAKATTKATPGGGPVHSFATLLDDLATIAASRTPPAGGLPAFPPTPPAALPPSPSPPPPPPPSARPSGCSASRTASGTRSQAASDHRAFPQADALPRSTRGNFGLRSGSGSLLQTTLPGPWSASGGTYFNVLR